MKVVATTREQQGTGASRRLRRAGRTPGIVYGGTPAPQPIEIDHNALYHALQVEAFHSTILDLEIDGKSEQVLLRAAQMHPFRQQVLHVDFQRIDAAEEITIRVPLRFLNQENSPAVKLEAAIVSHIVTELEIRCLPKDLPAYIEVDLAGLAVEHPVHLDEVVLPAGVELTSSGEDNPPLAIASVKAGAEVEEDADEAAADTDKAASDESTPPEE